MRIGQILRSAAAVLILPALLLAYAWSDGVGWSVGDEVAGDAPIHVADGDIFRIGKSEFRLRGFDAPEYHQSCADAGGIAWPCGRVARLRLEALLSGPGLTCTSDANDRFGRTVAKCHTEATPDIGEAMVVAEEAISPAARREAVYAEAEKEARPAGGAIWQGKFETPAEWRKVHQRGVES